MNLYLAKIKTDGKSYSEIEGKLAEKGYFDIKPKNSKDYDLQCKLKSNTLADALDLSRELNGPKIKVIGVVPCKT